MTIFISTLLWALIALIIAYIFILVRPSPCKPSDTRLLCDYTHRGLHGGDIPENSLAAFERAVANGCGIELDVQLSRDGEVVVFHDYTLERMTGREGRLADLTVKEMRELRLNGADEYIPTLSEVLTLVGGRVPLLIELKGESADTSICPKLAQILREYRGAYCIESFNPLLIRRMSKLMPNVFRGILYTNVVRDKRRVSPLHIALSLMATNIIARPNFIAYNERDRMAPAVKLCTKLYHAERFVWTVRSRGDYDTAKKNGECVIFESFMP